MQSETTFDLWLWLEMTVPVLLLAAGLVYLAIRAARSKEAYRDYHKRTDGLLSAGAVAQGVWLASGENADCLGHQTNGDMNAADAGACSGGGCCGGGDSGGGGGCD